MSKQLIIEKLFKLPASELSLEDETYLLNIVHIVYSKAFKKN